MVEGSSLRMARSKSPQVARPQRQGTPTRSRPVQPPKIEQNDEMYQELHIDTSKNNGVEEDASFTTDAVSIAPSDSVEELPTRMDVASKSEEEVEEKLSNEVAKMTFPAPD